MQEVANPSVAEAATGFLTIMSALSTTVQQFVEHIIKKRFDWLNKSTPTDPTHEGRRSSAIHLISFAVGAALTWSVDLKPLDFLGAPDKSQLINSLLAGVMISFGSSFFDEALGAVREFKKAQASLSEDNSE